ncbi:hypothetical protein ABB02_00375 [Clostridiaceae bacterium JG1575]|nr:hypothetical protein ABB02_00375 [Clostridiaceae bacterium JG1575]
MHPKIIRKEVGNCCEWCKAVAGTQDYAAVKETGNDVFRRHRFCKCTVEYDPGDGKRQNVHTKKWIDPEKESKIEVRKANSELLPFKQAKTIKEANELAEKMGYKADYSGIDIKCANEWNEGLYNAKKDFPEVAEKIKFVGASQKRYSLMKKEIQEYYTKYYLEGEEAKSFRALGIKEEEIKEHYNKRINYWTNEFTKGFKVKPNSMASSWSKIAPEELKNDPMHGEAIRIREKYHGITMNNKYFDSYGRAYESGVRQVTAKWHPEGRQTVKATFDHEFAHQIDEYLKVNENENIKII